MAQQDALQEFVKHYQDIAFLVDFDGTMVDLVNNPEEVYVSAGLIWDLKNIVGGNDVSFAVVTGRSIRQLDAFLENTQIPAIGSHGAEQRPSPSGGIRQLAAPMPLVERDALRLVAEKLGCLFEDKTYSLAVHLPFDRAGEDTEPALVAALGASRDNYLFRKIGRTYEILQPNVNKGSGIAHLMQHPGFAGRTPVYIGDDVFTDKSLEIVAELGGTLMPVRHQHAAEAHKGELLMEVADVRRALSALGDICRLSK